MLKQKDLTKHRKNIKNRLNKFKNPIKMGNKELIK